MEFLIGLLGLIYCFIGIAYTLVMSMEKSIKPNTVGELVIMILMLPFTIFLMIIFLSYNLIGMLIDTVINSNWFNKKL